MPTNPDPSLTTEATPPTTLDMDDLKEDDLDAISGGSLPSLEKSCQGDKGCGAK